MAGNLLHKNVNVITSKVLVMEASHHLGFVEQSRQAFFRFPAQQGKSPGLRNLPKATAAQALSDDIGNVLRQPACHWWDCLGQPSRCLEGLLEAKEPPSNQPGSLNEALSHQMQFHNVRNKYILTPKRIYDAREL